MSQKKIAVIILNWNGEKLLEQFLPSVILYSNEASIYVVDNGSTDNSIQTIKSKFQNIKVIENKENFGFAKGYNEAIKKVKEPILCLLNSDVEVTENWLIPIINEFENNTNVGILQPKILDYKRKNYFEYAGAAGGFIDRFGFPYCRGRIFETLEKDLGQYEKNEDLFWASGACFFVRKSIFDELNGFDEDFFAHQEEIDFCWRTINKGYLIKYIFNSKVYHVGGATLKHSSPKKTYLNFRNSLFMLVKNLPSKSILIILFLRLCFDGIAGIKFLFQGKFKHTIAIVKAHFSFYFNINKMIAKRTPKTVDTYYQLNSIVMQYYILRNKIYSEIK